VLLKNSLVRGRCNALKKNLIQKPQNSRIKRMSRWAKKNHESREFSRILFPRAETWWLLRVDKEKPRITRISRMSGWTKKNHEFSRILFPRAETWGGRRLMVDKKRTRITRISLMRGGQKRTQKSQDSLKITEKIRVIREIRVQKMSTTKFARFVV
jgi:hypothetical protein